MIRNGPGAPIAGPRQPTGGNGREARGTSHPLQSRIAGDVFVPGDAGYVDARLMFLPPDAYRRLQQIKAHYDPDEVVISGHRVRPADR